MHLYWLFSKTTEFQVSDVHASRAWLPFVALSKQNKKHVCGKPPKRCFKKILGVDEQETRPIRTSLKNDVEGQGDFDLCFLFGPKKYWTKGMTTKMALCQKYPLVTPQKCRLGKVRKKTGCSQNLRVFAGVFFLTHGPKSPLRSAPSPCSVGAGKLSRGAP